MDLTAFFSAVQNGGPPVIFVLAVLITLFLTGEVRVKREVEDRDQVIQALEKRNEDLLRNFEKEHELFQASLSLIRDELLPMVREDRPQRRRD